MHDNGGTTQQQWALQAYAAQATCGSSVFPPQCPLPFSAGYANSGHQPCPEAQLGLAQAVTMIERASSSIAAAFPKGDVLKGMVSVVSSHLPIIHVGFLDMQFWPNPSMFVGSGVVGWLDQHHCNSSPLISQGFHDDTLGTAKRWSPKLMETACMPIRCPVTQEPSVAEQLDILENASPGGRRQPGQAGAALQASRWEVLLDHLAGNTGCCMACASCSQNALGPWRERCLQLLEVAVAVARG